MKKSLILLIPVLISSSALVGCDQTPSVRRYHEVVESSPILQARFKESITRVPVRWTTPEGWDERRGDGMRLATFIGPGVETTLVSLDGQAGGLQANATRWMQQIKIPIPEGGKLTAFLDRQEHVKSDSGMPVQILDFTEWQEGQDETVPSMIAAVIDNKNSQIFVKMTGAKGALVANKSAFRSLVRSIQPHTP